MKIIVSIHNFQGVQKGLTHTKMSPRIQSLPAPVIHEETFIIRKLFFRNSHYLRVYFITNVVLSVNRVNAVYRESNGLLKNY